MTLIFRPLPMPPLDEVGGLLADQLGLLLEQALEDGPSGEELLERFAIDDDGGVHQFDLGLFCGDDGAVYRAGTLELVASFSQGGATGSDDLVLLAALNDAHDRFRAERESGA